MQQRRQEPAAFSSLAMRTLNEVVNSSIGVSTREDGTHA
jgi:hypothetical protein